MHLALLHRRPLQVACALFALLLITWCAVERPVKAERRLAERVQSGKAVPWHFYAPVWSWRGLTAALPVAALLIVTTALGTGRVKEPRTAQSEASAWEKRIALSGVVALACMSGIRMNHSLWGDEDYTVKTYVRDEVLVDAAGKITLEKPSWENALWNYKRPNNHVGFTLLAKAAHDLLYHPTSDAGDYLFKEWILRLPAWLAGIGSVWALWWVAGVYGWRGTGSLGLVVFYYCVHPWVVRFTSEARGYSIVLLMAFLALGSAGRAVHTGHWRWWCLLGLVQFYALWTWVSSIYLLLPLNLALAGMIWQREDRWPLLGRWLTSGLITTLLVALLIAPLLPQLQDYLHSGAKGLEGKMDGEWITDAISYVLYGVPAHSWDEQNPLCASLSELGTLGWIIGSIAALAYLVSLIDAGRLVWAEKAQRWFLGVTLGTPLCLFAHMISSGMRPYPWYLIILLPSLLWLLLRGRLATQLALVLCIIICTGVPTHIYSPLEANRESVQLTRKVLNPLHPDFGKDSITAGCTMFTEAYDPTLVRFSTVDELRALMQQARQSGRALYVNFSSRAFCEASFPELFQILNDPALFQVVQVLPGQFAAGTREVLKAR
jgi:hypothetical protein